MMKKLFPFLVLFLSAQTLRSQCIADSSANVYVFVYEGKVYEIVKETQRWDDAAACALERGGELIRIDDQNENDTLAHYLNQAGINNANTVAPDGGNASYVWIGGNDLAVEGEWVWDGDDTGSSEQFWQGTSSGSPVNGLYNNWGNEPDDFQGQDGLAYALTNWPLGVAEQWNDVDVTNALYYVIEYPASSNQIDENDHGSAVNIYPNPSSAIITVQLPQPNEAVKIYDLQGKLVGEYSVSGTEISISIQNYQNGKYLVYQADQKIGAFVKE